MSPIDVIVIGGGAAGMIAAVTASEQGKHVFLLEKGQVKEEGTHRELMAKNGLYADMYNKQAENYLADKTKQTEGIWA